MGAQGNSTIVRQASVKALLLQAQGKLEEVEPLFRRVLEVSERALGTEHPSTLSSVNNLATLLQAQGKFAEAEPLYRRALEAREPVSPLSPFAPAAPVLDTLTSVNKLALLLK